MNISEVIKYPILTEKTYAQVANDVYAFAVDLKTNRTEVKKAVEFIFQVKVAKVNIINIDKKPAQLGRSKGFKSKVKKAIVILKEGKINLYPEDVAKTEKESKKETEPKVSKIDEKAQAKISETEAKAKAKIASATKKSSDKKELSKETTTAKKEALSSTKNKQIKNNKEKASKDKK